MAFRFPRKSRQCGSATPNGQGQSTITLAERERAIGITLVIPFLSSLISSIGLRVAWAKSLFCNDWPAFSARFRPPFAPLSAWFRRCNSIETISKSARTFEISPSTAVNLPSETSLSRMAFHLRIETPQTPDSQRASSGIGPPRSYIRSRQRLYAPFSSRVSIIVPWIKSAPHLLYQRALIGLSPVDNSHPNKHVFA